MRSVSEQITLFAVTVALGILLGILFDFYRVLRGIFEPGRLFTILGDLLFWLLATALVYSVLMWKTWGELRAYVFVGLLLGFIIHWYYFSSFTLKIFRSVIFFLIWILKISWSIISWPFIWGKKILLPPFLYLLAIERASKKAVKTQKQKLIQKSKEKIKTIFTWPRKKE